MIEFYELQCWYFSDGEIHGIDNPIPLIRIMDHDKAKRLLINLRSEFTKTIHEEGQVNNAQEMKMIFLHHLTKEEFESFMDEIPFSLLHKICNVFYVKKTLYSGK